jgi:hypothetical protein
LRGFIEPFAGVNLSEFLSEGFALGGFGFLQVACLERFTGLLPTLSAILRGISGIALRKAENGRRVLSEGFQTKLKGLSFSQSNATISNPRKKK